ncbi:MAG: hypothetical protein AAGE76_08215 [Pseudomonadota bacterium]
MAKGPGHRASPRTRFVGFLKIALPLVALGLLAAVFLWREAENPDLGLNFTPADLAAMRTGLTLTAPTFSGASARGDTYEFQARVVMPRDLDLTMADVEDMAGTLNLIDGRRVDLSSDLAELDIENRKVALSVGVTIETSDGYAAEAARVDVDVAAGRLIATGPVTATGPLGEIRADRLELTPEDPDRGELDLNDTRIRFTGGVVLRYTPDQEAQ